MTYPGAATFPGASTFPGTSTGGGGGGGGASLPTFVSSGGQLTVSLNATVAPPRAEIVVAWPTHGTATVTRTDPDGSRWPVRQAEPATLDGGGGWVGFDYEVPYGVPVTYTLTTTGTTSAPTVTTDPFQVPYAWRAALVHPGAPMLSVPLILGRGTAQTVSRKARQASLTVLGRRNPVVVSDVRESRSSQLVAYCATQAELQALDGVLADGSTLRLACDPTQCAVRLPQTYVAIGDASVELASAAFYDDRMVTLPYQEVDRPAGAFQGVWTYATLDSQFATYPALAAGFVTYSDLSLDRPR